MESLTFCPIDTKPIIISMLSDEDINWLNNYHAEVYETLSPELNDEEREWLRQATRPIEREKA